MAISDVIGKIFGSVLLQGVSQATTFQGVVQDRSGEIRAGGNGLVIPLGQNTTTVGDYPAVGSDISYDQMMPAKAELNIDKRKYVAISVEDIDEVQTFPSLIADASSVSIRSLATQMSADFRAAISGATYASGNTHSVSVVAAESLTDDELKSVMETIFDVVAAIRSRGHSQDPYIYLPVSFAKAAVKYFGLDAPNGAFTTQAQSALVNGGLGNVFGAVTRVDWGDPGTPDAGDDVHMYMGVANRTFAWGRQLSRPEVMRDPNRFATLIRSLMMYGIAAQDIGSGHKISLVKA